MVNEILIFLYFLCFVMIIDSYLGTLLMITISATKLIELRTILYICSQLHASIAIQQNGSRLHEHNNNINSSSMSGCGPLDHQPLITC